MVDVRYIHHDYFHPWFNYNIDEAELFKKPSTLSHFKKRIDVLIERRNEGRLDGLKWYEGDFFDLLKRLVFNLIPTQDKELTSQIYQYIYDVFGHIELQIIVEQYSTWLKNFK